MQLPRCRVLDVGGATGNNLLKEFGIDDVVTLDLNRDADVVASADRIPLVDKSFDIVTCIDTLEHIPKESRVQAVKEMLRVASKAVLLVAPMNSENNRRAEELVLRYRNILSFNA